MTTERLIRYGDFTLLAPVAEIRNAMAVLNDFVGGSRRVLISLINDYLTEHLPSVHDGTADETVLEVCMADLAVWFANEVLEGRASLEIH